MCVKLKALLILKAGHRSFTQQCSLCTGRSFCKLSPHSLSEKSLLDTDVCVTDVCDRAHLLLISISRKKVFDVITQTFSILFFFFLKDSSDFTTFDSTVKQGRTISDPR